LGAEPSSVRRLSTLPESIDFDLDFSEPVESGWGMASARHREVSRRGGLVAARKRRAAIEEPALAAPPTPPDGYILRQEIERRFGVPRKTIDAARVRRLLVFVALPSGRRFPAFAYQIESVERYLASWSRRSPRANRAPASEPALEATP
jgi:hypothetical protein